MNLDLFDYLVLAGIGLLVFFTPFAAGGVDVWALGVTEGICFALALIWLVKSYVFRRGGFPTFAQRDFRGFALAAGAFIALLTFQLVPLPPGVIKLVSPATYRLYQKSLPGWPERMVYADPGYVNPPVIRKVSPTAAVLPTVDEVRSGAAVPFAPPAGEKLAAESDPLDAALTSGTWRTLSVMPLLTRAGWLKASAYAALFFVMVFYRAGAGEAGAERKFRRAVALMVLFSGIAVAMAGLSQEAPWSGQLLSFFVPPGGAGARASGPFVNPDHFANYLAMVLPLALAGALFRVPLDPVPRFSGFQFICAAAAVLMVGGIMISLSRAGWIEIGLAIVIFAYLLEARRRHHPVNEVNDAGIAEDQIPARTRIGAWFLPLGLGLTVVALAAMALLGPGQQQQAGARVNESISGGVGFWDRIDVWADSAKIVRDYPAFGTGSDSWPVVFLHYQRPPWNRFFNGEAQNDYVEVAVECGIVGLSLLGWLCWKIGRTLYKDSFAIPSRHWPLFAALLPAAAVMGFHEALDFPMQIPANAVLFVIMIALAMRLARTYGGAPLDRPAGAISHIIVPLAFAAVAIAGLAAIPHQRETVYPDDLPSPVSPSQVEAMILSHPASPVPHLWLAGMVHDSTGAWLTKDLEAAVWLDPTNPDGRDSYIQALLAAGKRPEAVNQMTTAVYLAPSLSQHHYLNGRLIPWLSGNEREAVERGLRKASAQSFDGATTSLAQLYAIEGRQLDSAALYAQEAARAQDPTSKYNDYLTAAGAYAQAGEKEQAKKLWMAAINLAPDQPRAYSDLIGAIYGPERNFEAIARIIQTATVNGLDPAPLYLAMAAAAEAAGDHKAAEAALGDSLHYDPSYANLIRVATFYLTNQKYSRASELLHRALEINPNSGEAYFYLAQAEEGAYQYPQARDDYQHAIELAPDHPEYKAGSRELLHKIAEDASSDQDAPPAQPQ